MTVGHRIWARLSGFLDMRAPPPLLAAGGRLTINGLMSFESPVWGRSWLNTLGFTPDFDCEDEKRSAEKKFGEFGEVKKI